MEELDDLEDEIEDKLKEKIQKKEKIVKRRGKGTWGWVFSYNKGFADGLEWALRIVREKGTGSRAVSERMEEESKGETMKEGQAREEYLLACGIVLILIAVAILIFRCFR